MQIFEEDINFHKSVHQGTPIVVVGFYVIPQIPDGGAKKIKKNKTEPQREECILVVYLNLIQFNIRPVHPFIKILSGEKYFDIRQ